MHDPFAWPLPLGRLFGINIRIHWLFPFVAVGWILHMALDKRAYDPPVIPAKLQPKTPQLVAAAEGIAALL